MTWCLGPCHRTAWQIYPLWGRAACTSLATATNWTCNLVVAMTFLYLTAGLTRAGAFALYCALATIGSIIKQSTADSDW